MEKSTKKFEELLGTQIELDKLGINIEDLKTEKDKEKEKEKNKKEDEDTKEEDTVLNRFNKAYSMTGEAKLPGIRDYVNYLVDNSCKFLIFAHHAEVLDAIEDVILNDKIGYIRIDGKVPVERRQDLVNKFQTDEDCLVAILSITACATGLTLTKASTVVFAELHFTPSIMIQAEDRAHRIGQDAGCVNIHYLFGDDTLDVLLFRKLNEKQNIVSTTLDNKSKDLNVTKVKEQVGDFINMNGKQVSVDDRKNISQIVDKSNATIISYLSSKSQIKNNEKKNNINGNIDIDMEEKKENEINNDFIKDINIHESNNRRNALNGEEKDDEIKESKNMKKKKKKDKKKNKRNKSHDDCFEDKNKNISNQENNNFNENGDNKDGVEEEKEIENIFAEDFKVKKDDPFEDKVLADIFDFNKI